MSRRGVHQERAFERGTPRLHRVEQLEVGYRGELQARGKTKERLGRPRAFELLRLTVETTLSPNLAKNVTDGGRLTTTSTICSPPLVVPQEGLSREMTQSPSSAAVVFEAKWDTAGWSIVELLI